jgi:hypothetical protein
MSEHGSGHNDWHNDCHEFGYHCNCDCDEKKYGNNSSGTGGGISNFGEILCTIGGFIGAALVFMLLGIDVDDVPVIVILIVIVVVAVILALIFDKHGV